MNNVFASPILSAEEQGKFRSELLWELNRMIEKYNCGSGSSIRTEKAENILQSMLYCVSVYLENVPDAAAQVRSTSGSELFQRGLAAVKNLVLESKRLYRYVLETRIPTDLIVYNETIDRGIPAFIQTYDPEFAAHENAVLVEFDYPLLDQKICHSLRGALYLKRYLEELKKENEFCADYSKNHIRAVLFVYGQKYHMDYREMIVNIPEVLLEQKKKGGAAAPPRKAN